MKKLRLKVWFWSLIIMRQKGCLVCGKRVNFNKHEAGLQAGKEASCVCGSSYFI